MAVRLALGLVMLVGGSANAATLYSAGGGGASGLRVIDPVTIGTLSETTVTIDGRAAGAITGLVNDPQTGTLFGAVRTLVCADPKRTTFLVGGCDDATTEDACNAGYVRDADVAEACHWNGANCIVCSAPGCTDPCIPPQTCAGDPDRDYLGHDVECETVVDETACENAFRTDQCGPSSCRWTGFNCVECRPQNVRDGTCTNACGPHRIPNPIHLATIDPDTGVATSRGELGERFAALAFTCDGRLFGVTGDGACGDADVLYEIDPTDASKEMRSTLGNDNDGEVLAFNPLDGKLYYASGDDGSPGLLYQSIDPDTLAVTPLTFDTLLDDEEVQAIGWSEADQAFLWKQDHGKGPIYRTSPDGQTVTTLGETDHQSKGLAFAETVAACIVCGDGLKAATENCDDGNTTARDCCSSACTPEDAGFAGIACETGNLLDPAVCDGGVEKKTAKIVAKRGAKIQALADKAEASADDAEKAAKRLKAALKQVKKLRKVVAKRRVKLGEGCADALDAVLARLEGILGVPAL